MNGIGPAKARLLAENRIRWELGLNDPSFGGVAVTAGYALAAGLALIAARRAAGRSFERRFWWLACAVLLVLGLNKQLDLHILAIDWGRALAVDGGWYRQRRTFQRAFMAAVLIAGIAIALAGYLATRGRGGAIRLASAGLILTAGYGLARAAVFSHVGARWQGDWLIELAGLAAVALAAWRYRR